MADGEIIPAVPSSAELKTETSEAVEFANEVAVIDDATYEIVGEFIVGLKVVRKRIKSIFYNDPKTGEVGKGHVPLMHSAWKAGLNAYNSLDEQAKKAEEIASDKLKTFIRERDAAEAKKKTNEIEKRAQEAEALAKVGKPAEARRVIARPLSVAPASVRPKIAGLSIPEGWDFEIEDEARLERKYLVPDLKAIKKIVSALGDKSAIPGVRVFKSHRLAGTGRR